MVLQKWSKVCKDNQTHPNTVQRWPDKLFCSILKKKPWNQKQAYVVRIIHAMCFQVSSLKLIDDDINFMHSCIISCCLSICRTIQRAIEKAVGFRPINGRFSWKGRTYLDSGVCCSLARIRRSLGSPLRCTEEPGLCTCVIVSGYPLHTWRYRSPSFPTQPTPRQLQTKSGACYIQMLA